MKKTVLAIIAFSLFIGLTVHAQKEPISAKYFLFDSPKQLEFNTNDINKIAESLKLESESGLEYDAVVNVIDKNKLAISPLSSTKIEVRVKGIDDYKVQDYDKEIYIKNKKNLLKISKELSKKEPIYRSFDYGVVEDSAQARDGALKSEPPKAKENSSESNAPAAKGGDFSQTNIQTQGVDEADIVKTDGKYIYFVRNYKLDIVDANPKSMKLLSQLGYYEEGKYIKNIYVGKNKLSIIYDLYQNYFYDDEFYSKKSSYNHNENMVLVETYDTTNIKNPKKISSKKVGGRLIESRKIDDIIYLTTSDYFGIIYKEPSFFDNLIRPESKIVPDYHRPRPEQYKLDPSGINIEKMLYLPYNPSKQFTRITALSINNGETQEISYMGTTNNIYMSNESVYILADSYKNMGREYRLITDIQKFAIDKMNFKYMGKAYVNGRVINQFALNEMDGNLFVAYTSDGKRGSTVNLMASFDKNMKKISQTKPLAEGEKIYSVRYIGDKGYMVTFKNVDPLFVIDLKNPKDMKVLGYLKIPGYSEYLHPYKDNYLIGFGQNTKINEYDNVVTDGFKISLFDVSDFTKPKEIDVQNIGSRGTYSAIQNDHKALMFDYKRDIFAFPINVVAFEKKENGRNVTREVFSGAYVYSVSKNGFKIKGKVDHYDKKKDNQYDDGYYIGYDYDGRIQRIVQIGDNLYTLSESGIKVNDINTMKGLSYFKFEKEV